MEIKNIKKENIKEKIITAFVLYSVGCKLKCVFCGGKIKSSKEEIEKNIKNELDKIEEFANKFKIEEINISGNGPIEYPKLLEIIRKLKQIMPSARIFLSTHGLGLSFHKLDELVHFGLELLIITIHSSASFISSIFLSISK